MYWALVYVLDNIDYTGFIDEDIESERQNNELT